MHTRVSIYLVICACLIAGLTTSGLARPKRMKYIPDGTWGAPHINVQIENGSATISYDCANGTITGPLTLDGRGQFSLLGTHLRERPGPIRVGDNRQGSPARYTGWTDGRKMTLTVTLVDSKESIGTFTLTRGQSGRIRRCL